MEARLSYMATLSQRETERVKRREKIGKRDRETERIVMIMCTKTHLGTCY